MRILLLTDDMMIGGVPRHVVDLANGIAKKGGMVSVAASDGPSRKRLMTDVPFVPIPIIRSSNGRKNWLSAGSVIRSLIRFVKINRINVVHSHKRYSDLIGRLVARATRAHHLSTCHNVFHNYYRISVFGDQTIACCDYVRDVLINKFALSEESVRRVYYGIAPMEAHGNEKRSQLFQGMKLLPTDRVILSIGHLSPAKDRTTLIHGLAGIRATLEQENARCIIVGDGPESGSIRNLIAKLNLNHRVHICSPDSDIAGLISISEFLVLTSIQEGLPYVLLEAASLGKPHVATNVGGIPEFIDDGKTGLLVQPLDAEAVGKAIERMLRSKRLVQDLGEKAREKFFAQHTLERFLDDMMSIYESSMSAVTS